MEILGTPKEVIMIESAPEKPHVFSAILVAPHSFAAGKWTIVIDKWDIEIHFKCPNGHLWKTAELYNPQVIRCNRIYLDCDFEALVEFRLETFEDMRFSWRQRKGE